MRTRQSIQNKGLFWLFSTTLAVFGQDLAPANEGVRGLTGRRPYAVVLTDAPIAQNKATTRSALAAKQGNLAARFPSTVRVVDANQTLVNAIFILADENEAKAIAALAGVSRVEPMRPLRQLSNRAIDLMSAPGAWSRVGGEGSAGQGVKIGIIDTGIDHTHPAFAPNGLSAPADFPKCSRPFAEAEECTKWTNGKVIVARSYVDLLNFQFGDSPVDTRPDDVLPRDRVGHGTMAAMVAAGGRVRGPSAEVVGVAPRAWLGNYKVFGSPGVNDGTWPNAVIAALQDAARDGMDIVTLNLGYSAEWPPLLRTCTDRPNSICDLMADAVHNATLGSGDLPPITVLAAAGNSGDLGFNIPTLGTVDSPATAPGAIAVGAFTNAHTWVQTLVLSSTAIGPKNIRYTDGPKQGLTAPLRDVAVIDDDKSGRACRPLPANSLNGRIAIIKRNECPRDYKVINAQTAGAVGVILMNEDSEDLFTLSGLNNTSIPSVLIGTQSGNELIAFAQLNPTGIVTLDPQYRELSARAGEIAIFSSQGLPVGEGAIKPEVTAPGTDLYMATQKYDPNAALYDPSGFGVSQGTSFATPYAAGTAALVKQRNRSFSPAQVKSALVNTADSGLVDFDYNNREITARHRAAGGGRLNASDAVQANLTADPATISFGILRAVGAVTRGVLLRNHSTQTLNLQVVVSQLDRDDLYRVTVNNLNFTLAAGATTQLSVRVDGTRLPAPGVYDGFITISGGPTEFRIPYTYVIPDNVPFNIYPLSGDGFVRLPNGRVGFSYKVVDQFGAPVVGANVRLNNAQASDFSVERTDDFGIGEGTYNLGGNPGQQSFSVTVGNLTQQFVGTIKARPTVPSNGVVDAASGQASSRGYAPGSYISLFGSGLADVLKVGSTPYLPISLAGVSVSFDNQNAKVSVPGRLHFVSPGQINVQIPWECRGLTSVTMKVAIGDLQSATFNINITETAPAAFEYREGNNQLSAAALDESFVVVGDNNPARRTRAVQLYFNGLGDVNDRPASGEPAGASPLSSTRSTPSVSIGGRPAQVLFSGLAPGLVGVYQVNVIVPSDAPSGRQPVSLTINGIQSRNSFLSVLP